MFTHRISVVLLLATSPSSFADVPTVAFQKDAEHVRIIVGGDDFATYTFRDSNIPRPYLAHVRVPGGPQVTRNHPPVLGKDATDHDTFHPGIWLAFGDLSGNDSWRLKAKVRHDRFAQDPKGGEGNGAFTVANSYLTTDGKLVVAREECRLDFHVRPAGMLVVWDSTFSRGDIDCVFGDQEEMGLGVRVATPLTVKAGGRIRNSDGQVNEKGVWGKAAEWCDYGGVIGGNRVGIVIMPDPSNFRPCWYHARDYGFVAANPFGRGAFTKGEKSRVVVENGRPLRLRFGVLVYSRPGDDPIDAAAAYKDFRGVIGSKP